LFGHVPGAFTGAVRGRVGRFELASGGTLFLDEIASMSLRLQEKLLRVVEYGEFEKLGSSETQKGDVRLVGAANQDLPLLAKQGRFREDLLDRLSFDVVTVPPLRERREDILLLAQKFAQDMARELKHEYFAGFTPAAEAQMQAYDWPGNVRELRNVVERAVYRAESPKRPIERVEFDPFSSPYRPQTAVMPGDAPTVGAPAASAAPAAESAPEFPLDFEQAVAAHEVKLIRAALADARYNQRKAAQRLSLTYHQFRGLLRKYKLLDEARGE
jgi:psp operon transcriptional activator